MRARNRLLTLVSGAFLFSGLASADPPAVPAGPSVATAPAGTEQRLRGTITAYDGQTLTLKLTGRKTATLGITAATRLVRMRTLQLADVQPGAWVGVAALKGADGKLRAQGIRLYPPNMRGQGEGSYPLDPANPSRLLVNGAVTAVTPGGIGGVLTVAFHGAVDAAPTATPAAAAACSGHAAPGGCSGTAQVQFARGVPIISFEGGDASALLPGAVVTVTASADAGGMPAAVQVTIERDAPAPKVPAVP